VRIVTLKDRVYFFANGEFLAGATEFDGALSLGGTMTLGVHPNTTADFDSLIIRDTSPHDGLR
jgi:hypothetical protein